MFGAKTVKTSKVRSRKIKLSVYQRIIDHVFRPMHLGSLAMTLPNGAVLTYGNGQGGVHANIQVIHNNFFKKCVLYGDVGFGESYMQGDWQTDDITKVIMWMINNVEDHPTLMSDRNKRSPVNFFKVFNNMVSLWKKNSITGSRKNISDHYDLGNDFYQLFLDPSMTYSSAYFKRIGQTLEEAQCQKYEELCQKLRLKKTDLVLEIGSGWGGFAIYAAKNFGCHVTTVTISEQQFNYAQKRVAQERLTDKITVDLKDYRKLKGQFDKIISIEMLEAVGHEYYGSYFSKCHALLKKDGLLALQMILSPDNRYESFRRNIDWIQKHIFPGSLLPSMAIIHKMINQTGNLNLYHFEDITSHYARTLAIWRGKFNDNLGQVRLQGFDEPFIRKWNYYLSYCEAAFITRNISVAQAIFTRPNNLAL